MVSDWLFSKIRIGAFIPVVGAAMLALALLICALTYGLFSAYNDLAAVARQKSEVQAITGELRKSSDHLTRLVRLYAVSGEEIHINNYREVLAIRRGESPRPQRYEHIYWDLSPDIRARRHPPGAAQSLSERLARLPLLPDEQAFLEESLAQSDRLAELEKQFIDAAARGDYGDRQAAAREMLFSDDYQSRKSDVMLPLDKLLDSLDRRYETRTDEIENYIGGIFSLFAILLAAFLAVASLMLMFMRQKVLAPMHHLLNNIRGIRRGEVLKRRIFYSDEFGDLMRQFYSMKEQMDRSYQDLEMVSFTDELTGLYNRHYFFQMARQQLQVAARAGHPVSILICDVDHFKSINDTHGHLVGDKALKHIAELLRNAFRESDVCARFGGEEFVILLNDSPLINSIVVAEKIRETVADAPYKDDDITLPITISIGVATIQNAKNPSESAINDTIDEADKALYEAKNAGRNCVRSASST